MIDVEKTQLFPSLLGNDEEGIQEIKDLREIEDVQDECNGWLGVVEVVAWDPRIASIVGANNRFNAHV